MAGAASSVLVHGGFGIGALGKGRITDASLGTQSCVTVILPRMHVALSHDVLRRNDGLGSGSASF
jgi:hypothetical protein